MWKDRHTTVFSLRSEESNYTFKLVLVRYSFSYKLCKLTRDTLMNTMYLTFVNLNF